MKKIIIHCSATPNGRNNTAEDIHNWHLDLERGFVGIGYHYVIEVDGKVVNGRPEYWEGAHAYGYNKESLGICLIGTDIYSKEQWQALESLVTQLTEKYSNAKVIGHNEVSSKTCPNFDVQEWQKRILKGK